MAAYIAPKPIFLNIKAFELCADNKSDGLSTLLPRRHWVSDIQKEFLILTYQIRGQFSISPQSILNGIRPREGSSISCISCLFLCVFVCMVAFQLAFVYAVTNGQWFSEVFLSWCSDFNYRILSDFNAAMPEVSVIMAVQYGFLTMPLVYRDCSGFWKKQISQFQILICCFCTIFKYSLRMICKSLHFV